MCFCFPLIVRLSADIKFRATSLYIVVLCVLSRVNTHCLSNQYMIYQANCSYTHGYSTMNAPHVWSFLCLEVCFVPPMGSLKEISKFNKENSHPLFLVFRIFHSHVHGGDGGSSQK